MDNIVFIDGNYLYRLTQRFNLKIDFGFLREGICNYFDGPVRMYYYYCAPLNQDNHHIAAKPLIDWLGYNGYTVRYHSVSHDHFENESRGFIAAKIAVDALMIDSPNSTFIFCVGNPELTCIVNAVSYRHPTVLLSYKDLNPHPDLRQACDITLDLKSLETPTITIFTDK